MKILITGASSYVGARIYFDLKNAYEVIGTYNSHQLSSGFMHADLTNKEQIGKLVADVKPELIVHVANYSSPRPAENNELEYAKLNLDSTANLVESENKTNTKLIFISSFAALNPSDIYGKLKLESENIAKQTTAGYLILRPCLIVGFSPNTVNDRPFNRMLKCVDQKIVGQFDTSWKFTPTYIGHFAQIISQAITKNIWNETIPVVIDAVVTQYQTAKDILKEFGIEVRPIDRKYSIPLIQPDLSILKKFDLTPNSYREMIKIIAGEIKNRKAFILE